MRKIISSSLVSLIALSLITACSSSEPNLPVINQSADISSNTNDISNKYVATAQAIIDKMPKVTKVEEQDKLVKDFEPLIKPLNRFALDKLTKYAVKVLQDNLKPGEQPNQTSTAKLIHSILSRVLTIHQNLSFAHVDLMTISEEKDSSKQDKLIADFEKSLKKLVKADIKELIDALNGRNSNLNDFIPIGSPLSNRILKILSAKV